MHVCNTHTHTHIHSPLVLPSLEALMACFLWYGKQASWHSVFDVFWVLQNLTWSLIFSLGKSQKSQGASSGKYVAAAWVWFVFCQQLLHCHSCVTCSGAGASYCTIFFSLCWSTCDTHFICNLTGGYLPVACTSYFTFEFTSAFTEVEGLPPLGSSARTSCPLLKQLYQSYIAVFLFKITIPTSSLWGF